MGLVDGIPVGRSDGIIEGAYDGLMEPEILGVDDVFNFCVGLGTLLFGVTGPSLGRHSSTE